jgi:homoserine O-acetyltransferase
MPGQSVGVVQSQRAHFDEPLQLRSGGVLPAYDLVYETYGSLNAAKSNAILVCHTIGPSSRGRLLRRPARQYRLVGQHRRPWPPLDTDKFFIVGLNNLGAAMAPRALPRPIQPPANRGAPIFLSSR